MQLHHIFFISLDEVVVFVESLLLGGAEWPVVLQIHALYSGRYERLYLAKLVYFRLALLQVGSSGMVIFETNFARDVLEGWWVILL
jgi:hypothetical protein